VETVAAPAASPAPDLERIVADHDALIRSTVRACLPRHLRGAEDDVAQESRLHLWRIALPRFDPARAALVTFIRAAVRQVTIREIAKLNRRRPVALPDEDIASGATPDVEALAAAIRASPESFLTPRQAELFRLLEAGLDRATIGERMGLARVGVHCLTHKMKRRIGEVTA
jgi:hypothetical protein